MKLPEDEQNLLQKYREIKRHGWGKLEINTQITGNQKVSILITGGKTNRFIIEQVILD